MVLEVYGCDGFLALVRTCSAAVDEFPLVAGLQLVCDEGVTAFLREQRIWTHALKGMPARAYRMPEVSIGEILTPRLLFTEPLRCGRDNRTLMVDLLFANPWATSASNARTDSDDLESKRLLSASSDTMYSSAGVSLDGFLGSGRGGADTVAP